MVFIFIKLYLYKYIVVEGNNIFCVGGCGKSLLIEVRVWFFFERGLFKRVFFFG